MRLVSIDLPKVFSLADARKIPSALLAALTIVALGACATSYVSDPEAIQNAATTASFDSTVRTVSDVGASNEIRAANERLFPPAGPVENQDAILKWEIQTALETADNSQSGLIRLKAFSCATPGLVPTHPQQTTKVYHRYLLGSFSELKLVRSDFACKIGSGGLNRLHQYSCLLADQAIDAVISDLYQDHCGHVYRGFWHTSFLKRDETMASLFALGRTLYQDRKAEFPGVFVVGQTFPLDQKDFLFLAEPFAGDDARITLNQTQAKDTHILDAKTLLYQPIHPIN